MERPDSLQERRRYPRVESNLPLQYKNLRKIGEAAISTISQDICEGGVSFKSSEFISLACRLVVEITLPTSIKPIKAISKVAWIRKIPASDHYELGNQFLDMAKDDKVHVMNFVNNVLNKTISPTL